MTKLEREILKILTDDARHAPKEIAVMLGVEEQKVKHTIKELETKGIIVKYTTVINEEKMGKDLVEAFIEVKVSPQHNRGFDAIAEEIYQFEEVKSLYLMSGAYDLAVIVEGKTLKEVAMFVSQKLSTLERVISTATHFILKKYKDGGVLLNGRLNKRLPVHV
ncbi:MAG TPA: Lrp/AsnC family transcriptional regulator [Clostridiales bacterium]|nr:Lrp/AsnC family transcriptional regulator [Clostridiales bacterium]